MNKRTIRLIASAVGLFLLIALSRWGASFLLERELRIRLAKPREGVEAIAFDRLTLKGFSGVQLEKILVTTAPNDTLLSAASIEAKLSTWQLLMGSVDLQQLHIEDLRINLVKDSTLCNYCALLSNRENQTEDLLVERNSNPWSERIDRLSKLLFGLLPAELTLTNFHLQSKDGDHLSELLLHEGKIVQRSSGSSLYHADFSIESDGVRQQARINGELNKSNRHLSGEIETIDSLKPLQLFFQPNRGAYASFRNLNFSLSVPTTSKEECTLSLVLLASKPELSYWRFAPTPIQIGELGANLQLVVAPSELLLVSGSTLRLNQLTLHPTLRIERESNWQFELSLYEERFSAEALLQAIPLGLFENFNEVKLEGDLRYKLYAKVDLAQPDSLQIESQLTKHENFKIVNAGNLKKMNDSFLYTPYEAEVAQRSFLVGSENPNFRTTSEVSPHLRQAILQSEDGQFFWHRGFRMDAIREALIHDLKVGRFARGGSTLSMQLIKNIFLNRNKNIARKVEEALIVWLIEENRLTSKERMFDLYLNIIEWGPNIYGVNEASNFYFEKSPDELTLDEAIFLASIIPRPKRYRWSLGPNGELAEHQYPHFRLVKERMFLNGTLPEGHTPEETPHVVLKGESTLPFR